MQTRIQRLTVVALAIALTYALLALQFVTKKTVVSPVVDFAFVYVTSAGFYQLIIQFIYKLVSASPLLLRLYWGRLYVAGLWSYTYTLEGAPDKKIYFGLWRIEQDLYTTKVVGMGLTDDFEARSHVRSVTDMVENGPQCEVVNVRSDLLDSASDYYSKTTMYFERGRGLLRRPTRMWGKTFIYGGPRSAAICSNSFIRHPKAKSEQDIIDWFRHNYETYGEYHPRAGQAGKNKKVLPSGAAAN